MRHLVTDLPEATQPLIATTVGFVVEFRREILGNDPISVAGRENPASLEKSDIHNQFVSGKTGREKMTTGPKRSGKH